MRMLEGEGFEGGEYVDIFDGGPTMSVDTDDIRAIREATEKRFTGVADEGIRKMLAAGRLKSFAACYGTVGHQKDGATLDAASAGTLGLAQGDSFLSVGR